MASRFIKGSENSTLGIGKDVRCDEDAALERKEDERWDGWKELMQSRKAEEGMSRREKELREIRNSTSNNPSTCTTISQGLCRHNAHATFTGIQIHCSGL